MATSPTLVRTNSVKLYKAVPSRQLKISDKYGREYVACSKPPLINITVRVGTGQFPKQFSRKNLQLYSQVKKTT
jgi:hypothetical protein